MISERLLPDAQYRVIALGCTAQSVNGEERIIYDAVHYAHLSGAIMGSGAQAAFRAVAKAVISEFDRSSREVGLYQARRRFGGFTALREFENELRIGGLPLTETNVEISIKTCQAEGLTEDDTFLVTMLLFGERVVGGVKFAKTTQ